MSTFESESRRNSCVPLCVNWLQFPVSSYSLVLPGLELAARLYREVVALGHGRSGTQALILALERLGKAG